MLRQMLDDEPEEERRGSVFMTFGVEGREQGVGTLVVVCHEPGSMKFALLIGNTEQDALTAVEGSLDYTHNEVVGEKVVLSA